MTQNFVAKVLQENANPAVRALPVYLAFQWGNYCYIVMEYIEGIICDHSDVGLVIAALKSLVAINLKPGPISGGLIRHPFFVERESSIEYESAKELGDHINNILRCTGREGAVNFESEINKNGLRLCPSDMNPANFVKDNGGRLVALDFGASCFLPPSFFALALQGDGSFTQLVANKFQYEKSEQVDAMASASYALVQFGNNDVGK